MNLLIPFIQNFILACLVALFASGLTLYLCFYKFKNSKTRKILLVLSSSLAAILLAYILLASVLCITGQYQVEKQLAIMSAKGIPEDFKSMTQNAPKNKSDNAASFYEAAKGLMISTPYRTVWELSLKYKSSDITVWNEADQQLVRQQLDSREINMIFDLFRQGAEKSVAVYEHDYTKGFGLLMPELQAQRNLFRLLHMKSNSLALDKKLPEAYSIIRNGFMAVKQLESEPFLISQLVNIACIAINIDIMNSLLDRYGIDSQSAKQLLDTLAQLDATRGAVNGINGEIIIIKDVFRGSFLNDSGNKEILKMLNEHAGKYSSSQPMKIITAPLIYWDYNCFLTNVTNFRDSFSEPYWKVEDKLKTLERKSKNIPFYYPITRLAMPGLLAARTKVARLDSEIDEAKLKLAIYIYKNNNGTFPEKLEQVTPDILKEIPLDPINGKPFSYSKDGASFKISSEWLNEKARLKK